MPRTRPSVRTLGLLLAVLLLPPDTTRAEEEDPVDVACTGVVAGLLRDLRDGDDAARAVAAEALRARARFALPYLLSAVESTEDPEWRERARELAEALGDAAGPDADVSAVAHAEFPDWERNATGALRVVLLAARPHDELRAIEDVVHDAREPAAQADLAKRLLVFAKAHPERLVDTLSVATAPTLHGTHPGLGALSELETLARKAAASRPRDEQAEIEFALARSYRGGRDQRLREFAREFSGTPAGLRASVERVRASDDPLKERVERLLSIADAHPGTVAAREALQNVAFHLASSNLTIEFPDPLERFRHLAAVAARLASTEFEGSEGALVAAKHLNEFYLGLRKGPEASARALLAAYREFYANHLLLDVLGGEGEAVGWSLVNKMERLHRALGVDDDDLPAAVRAELAALETALPDKGAIRYLRAEHLAKHRDVAGALALFEALENTHPESLYARKALAARAVLKQALRDPEGAEALYDLYVRRHPESPFTWLAALRKGHVRFQRGDVEGAIAAYAEAENGPAAGHPLLAVLAPLALGRAYEAAGDVPQAVASYRRALDAWPPSGPASLATEPQRLDGHSRTGKDTETATTRAELVDRLKRLDRPDADAEALARLVRGEALAQRGDRDEALRLWGSILAEHEEGPVVAEARERVALLWVARALEASDRSRRTPDEEAALAAVEEAERAGDRFGRLAAAFVRAGLRLRTDDEEAAEQLLREALAAYAASQAYTTPSEGPARDVTAIRDAAFAALAGREPRGRLGDEASPVYLALDSTVQVVHPDGHAETFELASAQARHPNLLYFRADQIAVLKQVIVGLGAGPRTSRKKPASPGSVRGAAKDVAGLLGRFLPVMPGHWGGWLVGAFPMFGPIHLEGETTASVRYRIGWGGGTAKLAKVGGAWTFMRTTGQWIE